MFEPSLPLNWGYSARKPEIAQISSAAWLAARSAPKVMRLCSNQSSTASLPAIGDAFAAQWIEQYGAD